MKIIVTGAAGFIGSNLVRHLVTHSGHQVLGIDKLTYAGHRASLRDLENESTFSLVQADICDSQRIAQIINDFQPEVIMHLAAESHVDRSIEGPESFIQTNIVGTYRLLELARRYYDGLDDDQRKSSFRFHHISTDEVYGSLGSDDPAFTETTAYDPHSPYSASKAASDHLVRAWHDTYGLPVLITNCSNNYGPYQYPEKLIPVVVMKAIESQPIPVYGQGINVRDWLFVTDHVRALEAVVMHGKVGQTYNIGGDNEQRNIDLVRKICEILDRLRPPQGNGLSIDSYASLITFVTDRPGHDLRYAVNGEKIKSQLRWQAVEDFDSGLEKTIRWYLENSAWCQEVLSASS